MSKCTLIGILYISKEKTFNDFAFPRSRSTCITDDSISKYRYTQNNLISLLAERDKTKGKYDAMTKYDRSENSIIHGSALHVVQMHSCLIFNVRNNYAYKTRTD